MKQSHWFASLFLISCCAVAVLSQKSRSRLCSQQSIQCPPGHIKNGNCSMIVADKGCPALKLDGKHDRTLGDLSLQAFHYRTDSNLNQSVVNATFSNIKWTSMTMKFHFPNHPPRCWNFIVNRSEEQKEEVRIHGSEDTLFWDCRIYRDPLEGHVLSLESLATDGNIKEYRKFSFIVPNPENINLKTTSPDKWLLMVYLEDADNNILLHWSPPPPKLNVSKYRINLSRSDSCSDVGTMVKTEVLNASVLEVPLEIPSTVGCYSVTVEPWLATLGVWGEASKSSPFTVGVPKRLYITIMIGETILVTLVLLLFFVLTCCLFNRKSKKFLDSVEINKTVLLLYRSSSNTHMNVIRALARFISETLHAQNVIYIDDNKNPAIYDAISWWTEAFENASSILIISSPEVTAEEYLSNSPFAESFHFMANLLQEYKFDHKKKFYGRVAKVCYGNVNNFFEAANNLPCYHLFKDCGKLFNMLGMEPRWVTFPILPSSFYRSLFQSETAVALKRAIDHSDSPLPVRENGAIPMLRVESDSDSESDGVDDVPQHHYIDDVNGADSDESNDDDT